MSLTTLPRETLDQVFSHLDWPDVKKLRTLHPRLSDIGLEFFPREVTLVATKWSQDRVTRLLSLEPVRKNVKALTICCYLYWPKDQGPNAIPDQELRKTVKKTYTRHCKMIYRKSYPAFLKEILQKLPSLESVAISDYPRPFEILPRSEKSMQVLEDRYLLGAGAPEGKIDLVKQVLDAVLLSFGTHSSGQQQRQRPSISLEYSYGPYGLEKRSNRELSPFLAGYDRVKHLKLAMAHEDHEQTGDWKLHETYLKNAGHFAAKMRNLESLELSLDSPWAQFSDFSGGLHNPLQLPKLKRLALNDMFFDTWHVIPFLSLHKSTLESLSFSTCTINKNHSKTSWFKFLKDIGDEYSLKSLELHTILQHSLEPCDGWPEVYPETIPPERAVRYLLSKQRTNMKGEEDAVSRYPYDWESITWSSVEADFNKLSRRVFNDSPLLPASWRDSPFAPLRWIPRWQGPLPGEEDDRDEANVPDDGIPPHAWAGAGQQEQSDEDFDDEDSDDLSNEGRNSESEDLRQAIFGHARRGGGQFTWASPGLRQNMTSRQITLGRGSNAFQVTEHNLYL